MAFNKVVISGINTSELKVLKEEEKADGRLHISMVEIRNQHGAGSLTLPL